MLTYILGWVWIELPTSYQTERVFCTRPVGLFSHHLTIERLIWCCLQKGEFIGRDALLRQREEGVKRMYVQLLLQDHDSDLELWAWGGEPIYRDNKYVGSTTTTGYGFTLRRMVRKL